MRMSGRRIVQIATALAVGLTAAGTLTACGSSDAPSAEQVARIKEQARRETLAQVRRNKAERDLRKLRSDIEQIKRERSSGASGSTPVPSTSSGASGSTACGDGLSVNSVTSCPFARNVRDTYEGSGGASTIDVYSPVTAQTYRMSCSGGVPVVCTGGNGAAVYIR
ncbi:MAG TPA: hypothetical protein VKB03_07665 [Conexibacter sp.]|nr:hypothetical protein [Conexibacter sp.]